jgi:glycosyltransferase involved in cell wall biosynthesis
MRRPLVSAVIPTRNRPELVKRALVTALAQTYSPLEIIVVIDGPDSVTTDVLASFNTDALTTVCLPESVGGSEARNIGVRRARGEWIAFLDDDDEWEPRRVEKQISAALDSSCPWPLVCSQVLARSSDAEYIWPEVAPRRPYSEYLLVRSRLTYGEALMQTSTLMTKRELLEQVPFRKGLRKHQDWDWVLRCTKRPDVEVIFVPEPLAVWYIDTNRTRVSQQNMWRISYDWIRESKTLVTKRAYSSFIATYVARQAAAEGAWIAFITLLKEACCTGPPRIRDLAVFFGAWLIPSRLQHKMGQLANLEPRAREVRRKPFRDLSN